jgi:hypothetical protein
VISYSAAIATAKFIDVEIEPRGGKRVGIDLAIAARSLLLESHPLPIGLEEPIQTLDGDESGNSRR